MKKLKQLFCRHVWIDDYIVYETLWPYTMSWQKVRRWKDFLSVQEMLLGN